MLHSEGFFGLKYLYIYKEVIPLDQSTTTTFFFFLHVHKDSIYIMNNTVLYLTQLARNALARSFVSKRKT